MSGRFVAIGGVLAMLATAAATAPAAAVQESAAPTVDPLHRPFDEMLDLYVRDGFVYYNALRSDRSRLDRYLASLDGPAARAQASGTPAQQQAFWINAYNAFVLDTVVDHFPIRGRSSAYPPNSIRQIPGAFDKRPHRAAGRVLTLDAIEKEVLAPLGDPRVFLALGRGAAGGGRLRSEAFDPSRLDRQLEAVGAEAVNRKEIVLIDEGANELRVSPIFSWREDAFVAALADKADDLFRQRSALERAVLALIEPHLSGSEAAFLEKNAFRMTFLDFDWRLNDLGSRTQD